LLAILAIVDIFLPAIVGNILGEYFSLPYEKPIKDEEALIAVIIAGISIFILSIGYFGTHPRKPRVNVFFYSINKKWLYFFFFSSVAVYFLNMYYDMKAAGGFAEYYTFKLTRAYLVKIEDKDAFASMLGLTSEFLSPFRLIALSIVLGNKDKFEPRIRRFVVSLTILLYVFSLYRGSFINLFICIIAIYEYRGTLGNNEQFVSKMKKFAIVGVSVFFLYGGIRSTLQKSNREESDAGVVANMRSSMINSTGASLMAIVSSERYLKQSKPLFYGQSYYEMFLSLVPRSIMPNKPKIYGIETLNIAKGHPDTTMDAITMPGEAIMNFGYFGLIIMLFWGILFKLIDSFRYYPRMKYFLAATVFSIASTCNWMSFTGFFGQTKYILFLYILIVLVLQKRRTVVPRNRYRCHQPK
jgi:oligosaccharide repeat unit polymerase